MISQRWVHERSSLVYLMLLSGFKYITCEVTDEERDFDWVDSLDVATIVGFTVDHRDSRITFFDVEGCRYNAAQPLNYDGTLMSYKDFLEIKYLLSKNKK